MCNRLMSIFAIVCGLGSGPVMAETFSVKLANNTPLFEGAACHKYEGKDAVRALMQLILSARIHVDIHANSYDSLSVDSLLLKKASAGQSVTIYSPSGRFPVESVKSRNVRMMIMDYTAEVRGPLIIRSDNYAIGVGNIELTEPLQVKNTFMVCQSNETADLMNRRFQELIGKANLAAVEIRRF